MSSKSEAHALYSAIKLFGGSSRALSRAQSRGAAKPRLSSEKCSAFPTAPLGVFRQTSRFVLTPFRCQFHNYQLLNFHSGFWHSACRHPRRQSNRRIQKMAAQEGTDDNAVVLSIDTPMYSEQDRRRLHREIEEVMAASARRLVVGC